MEQIKERGLLPVDFLKHGHDNPEPVEVEALCFSGVSIIWLKPQNARSRPATHPFVVSSILILSLRRHGAWSKSKSKSDDDVDTL